MLFVIFFSRVLLKILEFFEIVRFSSGTVVTRQCNADRYFKTAYTYMFFIVIVFWNSYLHDDYITTVLNMFRHRERERCWKQGCQLGMIVILTFKSSWICSAIFRNSSFCDLDVDRCCDWPMRDILYVVYSLDLFKLPHSVVMFNSFFFLKMLRLLDRAKSRHRLFCAWPPGREVVSQVWSVEWGRRMETS